MASDTPHSAEYFGPQRDFWWNRDFLQLMAKRWALPAAPRLLDVGCGVGHWGRLMLSLVGPEATLVGVDREPLWVEKATKTAAELGLSSRATYQQGTAEALPFPDASFDVVTCQTVLMHLKAPEAALAQMKRVLKPGGRLIASEPNNLCSALLLGKTRVDAPEEEILTQVRFQLRCERGKAALGEGYNSIGELVPGLFQRLGLTGIQAYQTDMATMLLPPYAEPAQRAEVDEILGHADRDFFWWDREDAHRFYVAGGGSEADFDRDWAVLRAVAQRQAAALRAGTEETCGSGLFFLISGTR